MKYYIHTVSNREEVKTVPKLELCYLRSGSHSYEPKTEVRVVYVPGLGLVARMECMEKNPKALVEEEDGDVYKDSCMEWFINCAPEKGKGYLNFESNAAGVLHCKFGAGRHDRQALDPKIQRPCVQVERLEERWILEYLLPMETISAVFGKTKLNKGDILRGNFYKCGDETEYPHYAMWAPVLVEPLDYHRPEYFGDLEIC